MRTLVDYLLYEAHQNFLIKGHTKDQNKSKVLTNIKSLIKQLFDKNILIQDIRGNIKKFPLSIKCGEKKCLYFYKNKMESGPDHISRLTPRVQFTKDYNDEIIKVIDEFFIQNKNFTLAIAVIIAYSDEKYREILIDLIESANGTVRKGGIKNTITGTFTSKDDIIIYLNSLTNLLHI